MCFTLHVAQLWWYTPVGQEWQEFKVSPGYVKLSQNK